MDRPLVNIRGSGNAVSKEVFEAEKSGTSCSMRYDWNGAANANNF